MPKTECLIINAFDGDLLVTIDDKIYELKELSRNERFSKNFEEVPVQKKRKNTSTNESSMAINII